MNVVQPAGLEGEVKLLYPLTMEDVVESILAEKLASKTELEKIIAELYQFARDPEPSSAPRATLKPGVIGLGSLGPPNACKSFLLFRSETETMNAGSGT